jgi:Protein of unknown function (DUF1553)/Protein of unknown function (DUF1549)/Planctomycete cytochrome C
MTARARWRPAPVYLGPAVALCIVFTAVLADRGGGVARLFAAEAETPAAAEPAAAEPAAAEPDGASIEFFEKQVRPILSARCFACHGPEKQESDLRLDSRAAALLGGLSGPAVVPGKLDESLLIDAIGYANEDRKMPPKAKLPEAEIAVLRRWVGMGAPWPNDKVAQQAQKFDLAARRASHWAWKPIERREPPQVVDAKWPRGPIDRFILARLEQEKLAPEADAQRRTLLRRVYLDLIGLPPTPEEMSRFLADPSPEAFDTMVDRLLASPRFGERWARHWLDLVRYCETYGHQYDYEIRNPWRYRDYVIRALNADLPYNDFLMEHVAGDLLPNPRRHPTEGYNESIIATGFWFYYEQHRAPTDVRQYEADCVDNQIDVMTKAFLGLTVGCARCHDHKFDAISTKDYYALANILKSSRQQDALLDPNGEIDRTTRQLQETYAQSRDILRELVPHASQGARKEFAQWLLYARQVAAGQPLERIAGENQLNVESFARWVKALESPQVRQPGHPLYAWYVLSRAEDMDRARLALSETLIKANVAACRESAGSTREGARDKTAAADDGFARGATDAPYRWIANAEGNGFADWFITGWAFGPGPVPPARWDPLSSEPAVLKPGGLHSGVLAQNLRGVARSPTFALTNKQIHIHARGHKARVRVVVDGFLMDEVSDLLFAGLIAPVKDKDHFLWITLAGDLKNHLGHRAYLVLEDDGDGFLEVDRILQSDGPPPGDPANLLLLPSLVRPEAVTPEALADAYGAAWEEALTQWQAGKVDAEHTDLLNWGLTSGLIDASASREKLAALAADLREHAERLPPPLKALAIADGTGLEEPVYLRGKHQNPGEIVPRRFLEALGGTEHEIKSSGSGRLELARQMLAPENPFVARVAVNRVWRHLFGRGIVATVDNFGVQGQPPTHPELLDYLADEFVRDGWSLKRLIRRLVLSRTYQMASRSTAGDAEQRDPANLLWHRTLVRRLEGEAIRDSMLAVSGSLNEKMFGPPVPIHLTPFMNGRGRPDKSGPLDGDGRRTIYLAVRRNFLSPMMTAFDMPTPFTAVGNRNVSNVPAQALIMLNDPLVAELSRRWAGRMFAEAPEESREARIARMYQRALCRPPAADEVSAVQAFLDEQCRLHGIVPEACTGSQEVWADLAHVLFNTKEFVLRE